MSEENNNLSQAPMSETPVTVSADGTAAVAPKRGFWHKIFGSTPGDGEMQPKEGLSFSICGFGQNLICTIVGSYLTVFMTDAIGFGAISVALLMLFARIYDAANDPIMGSIVDRTRTRWGKCRPYLKWMAIPIMLMTILCFLPWYPNSAGGFAAVTIVYLIWGMVYTVADVPYWGLSTAMSNDTYRRGNMLTVARLFCTLGAGLVTIIVPMITSNMTASTMNVTNASQSVINAMEGLFRNANGIDAATNLGDWFQAVANGEVAGFAKNAFGGVTSWSDYVKGIPDINVWFTDISGKLVGESSVIDPLVKSYNTAVAALIELNAKSPIAEFTTQIGEWIAESKTAIPGVIVGKELYDAIAVSKAGTSHDLRYIYFVAAIVCCVIALPLFFLGFKNTVERNQSLEAPPSLGHNLKLLFKNKPLMLIVLSGIGGAARMLFTYTGGLYFAKYVMDGVGFTIIPGVFEFKGEALYTIFTMAVVPGGLIASLLVPLCTKKFGKRNTYIWSHIAGGIAMLIAFLVPYMCGDGGNYRHPATIACLIVALVIAGVPTGFGNIITYAMIGDTVEYLELKTGERAEGICFAMQTLINKVGMAVGAFVGVLAYYLADVEAGNPAAVSGTSKDIMWAILMAVGTLSFFLTVIPLFFYKFNEKEQQEAVAEINRRKEEAAKANGLEASETEQLAEEGFAPEIVFPNENSEAVPFETEQTHEEVGEETPPTEPKDDETE